MLPIRLEMSPLLKLVLRMFSGNVVLKILPFTSEKSSLMFEFSQKKQKTFNNLWTATHSKSVLWYNFNLLSLLDLETFWHVRKMGKYSKFAKNKITFLRKKWKRQRKKSSEPKSMVGWSVCQQNSAKQPLKQCRPETTEKKASTS